MTRALLPVLLLTGCAAAGGTPRVAAPSGKVPTSYTPVGLERVNGQTAASLVALFGDPDADVREGTARKLQFQSNICVLDAYLYPPGTGAEPRVTYLDAREPDGSPIDPRQLRRGTDAKRRGEVGPSKMGFTRKGERKISGERTFRRQAHSRLRGVVAPRER